VYGTIETNHAVPDAIRTIIDANAMNRELEPLVGRFEAA